MPGKTATHFTPHFRIEELARCHDGSLCPERYMGNLERLAMELELIRKIWQKPITILSGWRSPAWNKKIGGAENSQHKLGKAADIVVVGIHPEDVWDSINKATANGTVHNGGLGAYKTFTHYDIRARPARWNG